MFESNRSISLPPSTNVITQYRFVSMGTGGHVKQAADTEGVVGISLEASSANQDAAIPVSILDGALMEVEAGATITPGVQLTTDSDGRAIPLPASGGTTHFVCGTSYVGGDINETITIIANQSGFVTVPA